MIPLLRSTRRWSCPNCTTEDVTPATTANRFHACPGLAGLIAPLVPYGTKAKVEIHEREDYVGQENVRLHEGRPVMNVTTTRDDGQDVTVFAPTASASVRSFD